jgi:hypothetical protein
MADNKTTIAIEVEVGGVEPSIESIKDLKNAIKAARDEQVKMASSFGEGSKEYLDASKKLSGLKDRVDDLNDSTQSLKGTGVEQLTQGFAQMKEGIMNLDFDKVKTGFTAMKSGIGAFASSAKTALQGVKGALIATGIGALVVALGVIVAYWDDIKGAIDGVTTAQKKLNEAAAENLAVEQDKLKSLEASDNLLKLQGKSEKEILQIKIAQLDAVYEAQEAQLLTTIQTQIAQVEAEKRNKAILSGMLEWVNKPMELIFSGIDRVSKMLGLNLETANVIKKANAEAGTSEDAEKEAARKKELDATIQQLKDLQSKRAGYKIAIKKIDDDAAKVAIDSQKEITAANLAAIKAIEDAKIAAIKDEELRAFAQEVLNNERRLKDIAAGKESETLKRQEREAQAILFENNLAKINADGAAKRKAEEDRIAAEKKAANDKELADKKTLLDQIHAQQIAQDEIDGAEMVAKAEKEKQIAQATQEAQYKLAENGVTSLQNLSDIYFLFKTQNLEKGSKAELEAAKKQFNVNKALQIASATIAGIQGVQNALTASSILPEPMATAFRIANAVTVGIASAANIAKIAASKFDAGGSGASTPTSAAPSAPPIPAPPISTASNNTNQSTLFDESGQNLGFKPKQQINVTATVGVDEIANKTNRVSVLEQQSTF